MARLRDIEAELPRFPVVNPDGLIKLCAAANNVTGALELDEDGAPAVVRSHEKKSWVMLQSLYQADGRMDLWKAWCDHQAARVKARKAGQKIPPFPAQYLPTEVQRRRAGQRPNTITWEMPALESNALEPVKVDGEVGEPKRGRSKG